MRQKYECLATRCFLSGNMSGYRQAWHHHQRCLELEFSTFQGTGNRAQRRVEQLQAHLQGEQ